MGIFTKWSGDRLNRVYSEEGLIFRFRVNCKRCQYGGHYKKTVKRIMISINLLF